jgi:hypothetical protein
MALVRLYLYKQQVVMPTVVETEAGFYIESKPVQVFKVTEVDRWKQHVLKAILRGNPVEPTPENADEPGSAILEHLHIDKWSTFERNSHMFTLHTGSRYISIYRTGKGDDGMWSQAGTEQRNFDPRASKEHVIEMLMTDIIQHPDASDIPRPTGLMLSAPKD